MTTPIDPTARATGLAVAIEQAMSTLLRPHGGGCADEIEGCTCGATEAHRVADFLRTALVDAAPLVAAVRAEERERCIAALTKRAAEFTKGGARGYAYAVEQGIQAIRALGGFGRGWRNRMRLPLGARSSESVLADGGGDVPDARSVAGRLQPRRGIGSHGTDPADARHAGSDGLPAFPPGP